MYIEQRANQRLEYEWSVSWGFFPFSRSKNPYSYQCTSPQSVSGREAKEGSPNAKILGKKKPKIRRQSQGLRDVPGPMGAGAAIRHPSQPCECLSSVITIGPGSHR